MHILFDEAGKLLTGRLLSEAESSLQVELDSGKRVKVKAVNALLRFEKPAPSQLMPAATALADSMELALAYEFAPEEEFGFADLAREYFSASAGTEQQVAALLCLHGAPHYFRRAGKGRYKRAPADILAQALAAIEKKKQVQDQIETWAAELANGQCPQAVRQQLYKILFKPDKNAPEYKAVVEAARNSHTAPLALLQNAGAISSAYQLHWQRFLFDQFPKGTGFPPLQAPVIADDLPMAPVQAFSIDDSHTTEIDDALSIQGLGSGTVTLGIHIAAPGLAVLPDGPIDQVARNRLSTVYMPGQKITMLPDEVVQAYTLEAGRDCPALSLYVTLDEATLVIQERRTVLERVSIAHNLRHDQLDTVITEDWLNGTAPASEALVEAHIEVLQPQLAFIFRLARHLKAQREVVRGKPENFSRPDYTFRLEGVVGSEPAGDERVVIATRQRGAPLDLMVAEAMILANSSWGQWLAECGVPGIYRSQASLQPGVKVRMGTKAQPHAGIGVPSYAWSTSPLRRYVDMVNQWQIIACVRHGKTAALVAPFKPKDANLFAIISAFDAAYSAYNGFQNGMERYWTLQHLKQNHITEVTATLIKDNLVRADTLPLVLPVMGADGLPRGAHVRVRLGEVDDITLDIHGTVIERLDLPVEDLSEDNGDSGEDDEALAAPLALAIDVDDAGTTANAAPPDNAN
ncbi:MAG: RNB domain-containing ribonuclease [Hydrogenophaga sp.]|uniref:ribonuclease catalytic domain-containing protein n=1 Tax=Hydrogenophaga sp. TaxID=1904254 RepID=UPI00272FA55B|nr:ribonuclease catalytic domain-containing protein [Hydrogenophaga sp.]MDP2163114.1 RNB domain-containing ribonuclease [Hydrogenophaga sp.]MDP3476427.1 RNB domain-containing ribonuclease [Hydrogenophaga sp.]